MHVMQSKESLFRSTEEAILNSIKLYYDYTGYIMIAKWIEGFKLQVKETLSLLTCFIW